MISNTDLLPDEAAWNDILRSRVLDTVSVHERTDYVQKILSEERELRQLEAKPEDVPLDVLCERLCHQFDVDVRLISDDVSLDVPTVFGREDERAGFYQLLAKSLADPPAFLARTLDAKNDAETEAKPKPAMMSGALKRKMAKVESSGRAPKQPHARGVARSEKAVNTELQRQARLASRLAKAIERASAKAVNAEIRRNEKAERVRVRRVSLLEADLANEAKRNRGRRMSSSETDLAMQAERKRVVRVFRFPADLAMEAERKRGERTRLSGADLAQEAES